MKPRHHPKPVMTVAQSVMQLRMLIAGCTDAALARHSGSSLATSYRMHPDAIDALLADERQYRAQRSMAHG